jgi:hypothetical protein
LNGPVDKLGPVSIWPGLIHEIKNHLLENLVYKVNSAPFFHTDFNHFTCPVSHAQSRKQFFAKLLGAAAAVSVAPKLIAQTGQSPSASVAPVVPVVVRSETRAVARRTGSA